MANQESVTTFRIQDYWTATMQKIMSSQDKFESKVKTMQTKAGSAFDGMKSKAEAFKIKNIEAIEGISSQVPGMAALGPAMANPYVLAGAAVVGLASAYGKTISMANEWEEQFAKVNVTLGATPERLQQVSDQVRAIASKNANSFMAAPEAFNKLVSGGLDEGTALSSLDPVLKAAKAGFTDVGTTAAAAIGTMNSTGIQDATQVLDVLMQTLKAGNAEFIDVANYLPRIIPGAKAVGFSFEETAGAFAFFTAQGFKAEQSATVLENTMRALGDPKKNDAFKKIGIDLFDANGKMKPMLITVEALKKKLSVLTPEGQAKVLSTLGLDAEAAMGLNTMIQNTDKFKEVLEQTQNSAGALNKALLDSATPMDSWRIIMNSVRGAMVGIGQTALPIIKAVGHWIIDTIERFKSLYNNSLMFQDALSLIGDGFVGMFKMASAPLRILWNMFEGIGNTIQWVSEKLGFAGKSGESFYLKMRPWLVWHYQMLGKIAEVAGKIMSGDFSGAWKSVKNFKLPSMSDIQKEQDDRTKKMTDKALKEPVSLVPPTNAPGGLPLGDTDKKKGGAKEGGVSGGGTKQITINISHLLSGVTINATQIKEGAHDIARIIQEELQKMLADTSLSVANE